jgi:hypothetical protein
MAYASQEQALRPPIREWHMPFVNGRLFVVGLEHFFEAVMFHDCGSQKQHWRSTDPLTESTKNMFF